MITKYRIKNKYVEAKIDEIEIIRETELCIFIPMDKNEYNHTGERMEFKMTERAEYYDTWDSAHAALTEKAEKQVDNAKLTLELANKLADNVNGMRSICYAFDESVNCDEN